MLAIIRQSPHASALARAIRGEAADWDLGNHLLAGVFDLLATANWQRGGDTSSKRPPPLPRPGMTARTEGEDLAAGRAKPVTTEKMDRLLGWTKE